MTAGDQELVQIVAALVVTLPAVVTVIVLDERRLSGVELARAWPSQSRDCAVFTLFSLGVPQLSVLVHFVRTRRSWRGAVIGLAWVAAIVAIELGAELLAVATVGWLGL